MHTRPLSRTSDAARPLGRRVSARLAATMGALALVGLLLPAPVTLAAVPAPAASPAVRPSDLSAALGADGTFHGAPGVVGTVDPRAWTLASDPATGAPPRFAPATAASSIAGPWSAFGSDGAGGGAINGWVYAVAVSGTDLYVGGAFTNAGGVAGADHIAKWNGFSWSAVGAPHAINDQVHSIAISGSSLYIGGRFTDAAGIATADRIARWNGSAWSALGSNGAGDGALDNWVNAIAISGTTLYAGGDFEDAAGIATADHVARWDGSAWSALGSDGAGDGAIKPTTNAPAVTVNALAVDGTDLYVGGLFLDVAGEPTADDIVRWDGSAWHPLDGGTAGPDDGVISGPIYAIAISGSMVVAGGSFQDANGLANDNVATWNHSAWSGLGSYNGDGAIPGNVHAIAISGTDVYVGGEFYDAAGIATGDRIARWDGAAWNALGSGGPDGGALDDMVDALAVSPSGADLYVGGYFNDAAAIATADHVALWGPPVVVRRPDGRIRVGTGSYLGNNVYNTTASGQSRTGSALRGHTVSFGVSIQNDGTSTDRFKVRATGSATTRYSVRYYSGTTDITAAVVAGTYTTTSIAKGSTVSITAKALVKSTATVGSSVTRLVTITSVGNAARRDAVKLVARRS